VVNAYCVNIIRFYSVPKKKDADPSTKKAKATDPPPKKSNDNEPPTKKAKTTDHPSKKAKAASLSAKAKAAGVEVITKQILKYVQNGARGKVINIPVSGSLKKQAFQQKETERPLRNRKDNQKMMMTNTIHWRKWKSIFVAKLLTSFSQRTAGHWFW
jgi:hypothetical protein